MDENLLLAFGLTLFAGLSTGIGSAMALVARRNSPRFLSAALGLSAGVMIYVSFVEMLAEAQRSLVESLGEGPGAWAAVGSFFAGIAAIALIDRLVPSYENPHEARTVEDMRDCAERSRTAEEASQALGEPHEEAQSAGQKRKLMRMGMLAALAIGIHNFPEGLATFFASLNDPAVGLSIAIAIAIHNIPEGIAVSVPIYYATGSRKRAFWLSFLSGLSEPLGALLGYLVLRPFFSETVNGVLLGSVAGVMVFISLDELFPAAREYGKGHLAIYGLVAGMGIMALSLLLLH